MYALSFAATVALCLVPSATASFLLPRDGGAVWGGYNITQASLDIAGAISSPTCNSTEPCQTFVNDVIPRCLRLQGDAGCWCGNHTPLHYCALCMVNPQDNTTNPDQTQQATNAHGSYHRGCAAFEAALNASLTSISSIMPSTTSALITTSATSVGSNTGSSSKSNTGAIVGGAVGGAVGLALIAAIVYLLHRRMKHKEHKVAIANSSASMFSEAKYGLGGPPSGAGSPPPNMGNTPPPAFNPYVMPPAPSRTPPHSAGFGGSQTTNSGADYDTSMFKHLATPTTPGYNHSAEPMR